MTKLDFFQSELLNRLDKIITSIENISSPHVRDPSEILKLSDNFIWDAQTISLIPINNKKYLQLDLLKTIDSAKELLYQNTLQFAQGYNANNCLLWGARGMGKSSLVKAVHTEITKIHKIKLIEIYKNDLNSLSLLLRLLADQPYRFILFCDDLSFDSQDQNYKFLKSILEGGLIQSPENLIVYATSNRKHLLAREIIENQQANAINNTEVLDEKISLADRFGLWIGFHKISQTEYLQIIDHYVEYFKLPIPDNYNLHQEALMWSITRASRSGRTAWQFIQNLAGLIKYKLP
ncbi:ATP-binding protein [Bartonella sp. DGB1]|uniref:ATP-binding protein n=1 Tax=Bartonella sp. DGB1 TaxID=3239807 RepID=UPI0035265F18